MEITKQMNILEVVQQHPKAATVMLRHGLHCVGCHVSAHETIEQGASAHGMSAEQIDGMVKEINEIVNKRIETIELTPKAIEMIKAFAKEDGKEGQGLRIVVMKSCHGFGYEMEFVKGKQEGDLTFTFDDVTVFTPKEGFEHLKGSEIDFIETLQDAGFRIDNPNSADCGGECACGSDCGHH